MMQMFSTGVARNRFAELRREALKGREILVKDSKQNNSPLISIISTELLDAMMENFFFHPEWVQDEDGSYTVSLDEIDVIGYGDTRAIAAEVLATAAMEYAELYFSQFDFYRSEMVNRGSHFPYLRRIVRCNSNISKVMKVLGV